MKVKNPIVEKVQDNINALKIFEQEISKSNNKKMKDIIMNFPIVYIHNWKSKNDYEVYIGESNNIFQRTRQHYSEMLNDNKWQHNLLDGKANLYVIGHEHFNKSMTLDIENRLIHYLTSVKNIKKVHNGRNNPQNHYYPIEELDDIFAKIWKKLRKDNEEIFPLESSIKDSAIFKASPLHKLTAEQQKAKEIIIDKVVRALKNDERGQLIFVEGEAGTGKTVLNSSTFYKLFCIYEEDKNDKSKDLKEKVKNEEENLKSEILNYFLLVNHDEQITVYTQIFDKLGIIDKYGQVVDKPTRFINKHSTDSPVDVVFVDEDQVLTTEQYWEYETLTKYRNDAIKNDNYIKLENQLRMHANEDVIDWINSFTKDEYAR